MSATIITAGELREVVQCLRALKAGTQVSRMGVAIRATDTLGQQICERLDRAIEIVEREAAGAELREAYMKQFEPRPSLDLCIYCGSKITHMDPHLACDECRER